MLKMINHNDFEDELNRLIRDFLFQKVNECSDLQQLWFVTRDVFQFFYFRTSAGISTVEL